MKRKSKRVLLKLSGEAFSGKYSHGIDTSVCVHLAKQISAVSKLGIELTLVVGGGNIFRGLPRSKEFKMQRVVADYMGMLATVLNGLALQNALENQGIDSRVMTAIGMNEIAEPYIRRRAIRHLEKKRVVIFVAGTGNPYFTTDTAAALRSVELGVDVLLKGTKVDGVYSTDPLKCKSAKLYKKLTYMQVINEGLRIMDTTAISLCMENKLPIIVFNFMKQGNLRKVVSDSGVGTIIK